MKKFFKRVVIILLVIVIVFELVLVFTGSLYVNKVLSMTIFKGQMSPDINEVDLFPKRVVETGKPQPWPISTNYNKQTIDGKLLEEMMRYKTVSFLVVKNDSLLHEEYWEGYNDHSLINSFSMAKSINAILIGCALKDGLIKSLDQPVSDFIPEFKEGEKSRITIRHLLTMSSGINFNENYISPFAWPAEAYYGDDVNGLTLKAEVKMEAGKTWQYKGGDAQLLGMIVKKATKQNIADYASEKLWKPIGAEEKALWSLDEKGMEKVTCCFYTNPRDYARIAKLYMHWGNWNGQQIVDSSYVKESIAAADLVDVDGKKNEKYGYQWWLMKHKGYDIFYMRGIRGQYVLAVPDLKIIVVRLGHRRAPKTGHEVPADVYTYLDAAFAMN